MNCPEKSFDISAYDPLGPARFLFVDDPSGARDSTHTPLHRYILYISIKSIQNKTHQISTLYRETVASSLPQV